LIGNWDGRVLLHRGYHFAFEEVAVMGEGQRLLRWRSAPYLRYNVLAGSTPDSIGEAVASGVDSGGETTSWTSLEEGGMRFYRVVVAP